MTSKAKKKTIDGIQFTVTPFPVSEAIKVKVLLAKTIGPAIGEAVGAVDSFTSVKSVADMKVDGAAISRAIQKLLEPLGEEEYLSLIERLFQSVSAIFVPEGAKEKVQIEFGGDNFTTALDAVFYGRLFSIYEVIILVLEANYPDFFAKAAQGIGRLIPITGSSGPGTPNGNENLNNSETSGS